MDETKVWIAGWICTAAMVIALSVAGKACNDADVQWKKTAIEKGCSVIDSKVVCK